MSGFQNWQTPAWLSTYLRDRFYVTTDVTAREYCAPGMEPWPHDGLCAPWPDGAFANPPWSQMDEWTAHAAKQTGRWIMLGPANISTKWFHNIAEVSAVYLPDVRIAYVDATGRTQPKNDTAIFVKHRHGRGQYGGIYRLGLRDIRDAAKRHKAAA